MNERYLSCVSVGFDVVQNEDGLHDHGLRGEGSSAAWAVASRSSRRNPDGAAVTERAETTDSPRMIGRD